MKKAIALLLCLTLLLVLPTGCKKKGDPSLLDDNRLTSDLMNCSHLYYYSHVGAVNAISNLKVVEKVEKKNAVSFSVTAKAVAACANIELAVDMNYAYENGTWMLDRDNVKVTKQTITVTAGPDLESTIMELNNYVSVVGNALAVKGEEQHLLPAYNVVKATWETEYSETNKTAKMKVTYESDTLSFTGYYNLTFNDNGWVFETKKIEGDERSHILLHLETLEQKEAEKTDEK